MRNDIYIVRATMVFAGVDNDSDDDKYDAASDAAG